MTVADFNDAKISKIVAKIRYIHISVLTWKHEIADLEWKLDGQRAEAEWLPRFIRIFYDRILTQPGPFEPEALATFYNANGLLMVTPGLIDELCADLVNSNILQAGPSKHSYHHVHFEPCWSENESLR